MADPNLRVLNSQPDPASAGVRRYVTRGFFVPVLTGLLLFLPARTLNWLWGWVVIAVYLSWHVVTVLVLSRVNPGVMAERSRMQEGSKTWDVWLVTFAAGIIPMATWLVAGFDFRLGWSPPVSVTWRVVAVAAMVLSYHVWMVWAMASNVYFSATVRIQGERGHQVASGGPYRIMRHPGYLGAILFQFALSIALGSVWSLTLGAVATILYVIRTALEDRTLQAELDGYTDYARRVPYKLVPGVW